MLDFVRTKDDVVPLQGRIAKNQSAPKLYGIDIWRRRMAGNHGIVMAINDKNGVRSYGRRHSFSLSITDADCDEPVPATAVLRATCSQVIEISRRNRYQFQNGTLAYLRLIHSRWLRHKSNTV